MTVKERNIVKGSYIFYYVSLIIAAIYCYINEMDGLNMGAVALFTCFLAPLALRLVKLKPTFEIYIVNIIFAYIASIIGAMLGGYSFPLFDKILHFSSGILISIMGYMLYSFLRRNPRPRERNDQILCILFTNAFNMMVAVFWEFFEYGCLIFLNNDAINHYTTGVHDSMTDMLVALLGGLIVIFFIYHYLKTGKPNIISNLNQHFYNANTKDWFMEIANFYQNDFVKYTVSDVDCMDI